MLGPILYVIDREDVEAGDLSSTLDFLGSLLISTEAIRANFQNIDLSFGGYDDDPRELFEIADVRDYVHRLDRKFPYWIYFMNLSYAGLSAITMCFLSPVQVDKGHVKFHPPALEKLLLDRWLPAAQDVMSRTGFSETEFDLLIARCMDYFVNGPQKPPIVN